MVLKLGSDLSSTYLLEHTEIQKGESVLDIGTGTGIQAIFAAEKASRVVAMDIDEHAIKNTQLNASRLGVSDKITTRKSDLFNALKPGEKFDVIISSIPYAWGAETRGNWKLHERFFRDAVKHLNPNGRIYFLTGLLRNLAHTRGLIRKNNLRIMRVNMFYDIDKDLEPIVYKIKHKPPVKKTKK